MNPMVSTLLEGATPGLLIAALMLIVIPWIDRASRWRVLPIAIVLFYTVYYLFWRVTVTIPPMEDPVDFIAGVLFFAVELAAVSGSVLSYVTLSRTRDRSLEVEANTAWLSSQKRPPLVDVFICTLNEEREILERTIIGASAMRHPNFRVWVLDDGRRDWLRELTAELGSNYISRPDNAHAKAGNINNALAHVRTLDEPPDYISILDADFVPTPAFLSRTLTLFRDENVGIVQTPQHFVNPDPIQANLRASDAWPDEQRYFFDVLMPSKDAWSTAFCCGTSSVIRMKALDTTGGFPVESVTEDYLLTLRMQRNGYKTVYLNERLSLGLAPEGLQEYITQRRRWCIGFFQIIRSQDGPFTPGNGLRPIDRFSLFESMLYWSGAYLFRAASIAVPVFYLLFGIHAVNVGTADGIAHFLPYYLSQITVMAWLSGQRVLPIMTDLSQLLATREILDGVAKGLFRPKGRRFRVTAKGGDRSKTVVQWQMLATFSVLLLATVLGIVRTFGADGALEDSTAVALYWSWYNMLILIAAIAVCIEKPRMRRNARLRGTRQVAVTAGGRRQMFQTADISVGGLRVLGSIDAAVGDPVSIELDGDRIEATIVRRSNSDFAVEAENSLKTRAVMVRHVYSGGLESSVSDIRFARVARRVITRLSM